MEGGVVGDDVFLFFHSFAFCRLFCFALLEYIVPGIKIVPCAFVMMFASYFEKRFWPVDSSRS